MYALVFLLLQEEKRAIFLPEAEGLIRLQCEYLRHAFQLAFADDNTTLDEIESCKTKEDFQALSRTLARSGVGVYFLLDQANAFDGESGVSRSQGQGRRDTLDWFGSITSEHFLILSASGTYRKATKARLTQEDVAKMDFFGGPNDVCVRIFRLTGDLY